MSEKTKPLSVTFVGDSGDGMQLIGEQFTLTALKNGYGVATLPDFPAEIRAPMGTEAGVSGFQVSIDSEQTLYEIAKKSNVIVAMNPAAAKKAMDWASNETIFILNEDSFSERDFKRAKLDGDFRRHESHKGFQFVDVRLTKQTQEALSEFNLSNTQSKKSKNFYALGLVLWMFDFDLNPTESFILKKFKGVGELCQANLKALRAGFNFADVSELAKITEQDTTTPIKTQDKTHYSYITGVKAVKLALAAQASLSKTPLFLSGYPITPASSILQEAFKLESFGVRAFQAEDEIAAIGSALGASFAGSLAACCSSGPGMSLKAEGLGLAVMTELPIVVLNVQRAGPSTGLPTKVEQSDLKQALHGRHGEAPLAVIAAHSPEDCFYGLLEAFRIAVTYMTPVIFLMDSLVANGANRWLKPDLDELSVVTPEFNRFDKPFARDEQLARNWPRAGELSQIHQLGGLEKGNVQGGVSYEPRAHQQMVDLRAKKIAGIAMKEPYLQLGCEQGPLVVVSWGGTYGSVRTAVLNLIEQGYKVSHLHLRQLSPLPSSLKERLSAFQQVVVCELNKGQLCAELRAEFLVDAAFVGQCDGRPFNSEELSVRLKEFL